MVAAILEAATRILGSRGWARFTTNEVAAVAGISIGSLYQYFPSKLALAEAIRQRHLDAVLSALAGADGWDESSAPEHRVAQLVDGVIAAHAVDPALHKVLLDEVPLAARSSFEAFEDEYQRRYRAIASGGAGIAGGTAGAGKRQRAGDALAGRVLAAAVEGVVHAAARRGELGTPALRRELLDLVRGYLRDRSGADASA